MTTPNSFRIPGSDRQYFKDNKQGTWRTVTEKEGPSPVGSPGVTSQVTGPPPFPDIRTPWSESPSSLAH